MVPEGFGYGMLCGVPYCWGGVGAGTAQAFAGCTGGSVSEGAA